MEAIYSVIIIALASGQNGVAGACYNTIMISQRPNSKRWLIGQKHTGKKCGFSFFKIE